MQALMEERQRLEEVLEDAVQHFEQQELQAQPESAALEATVEQLTTEREALLAQVSQPFRSGAGLLELKA